jgi:hypothetical protein
LGANTLSINAYHLPPLTPLPRADSMRSVHTEASTHDRLPPVVEVSAPCLATALPVLLCPGVDKCASTFLPCLPSNGFCYPALSRPTLQAPQRYYAGCDPSPARTRRRGLSASFALPSEHPDPNHVMGPVHHHLIHVGVPGRVLRPELRHGPAGSSSPCRRNGFVILRAARSPPAACHPASRRRGSLRLHVA